ncbi:hypothetical protein HML84_06980 [Alcanivorax sp. IO_7]|nr:hypothetical protein HML84_06980 [Alcanivorax sp. IO_7]
MIGVAWVLGEHPGGAAPSSCGRPRLRRTGPPCAPARRSPRSWPRPLAAARGR